ncbi:hypothetical protein WG66_011590, partial [Moniliophthora roreri]
IFNAAKYALLAHNCGFHNGSAVNERGAAVLSEGARHLSGLSGIDKTGIMAGRSLSRAGVLRHSGRPAAGSTVISPYTVSTSNRLHPIAACSVMPLQSWNLGRAHKTMQMSMQVRIS